GPRARDDGVDVTVEARLGRTAAAHAVSAVVEREHRVAAARDRRDDRRPVRQVAAVAMEVDEARAWLGGTHDPRAQALAVRGVDGDRLERHAEIARRLRLAGKRKEGEPRLDPPHQQRQREERDDESTQQGHQAAPRHTWPSAFAAASADASTSWTSKSTRSLQ